MLSFLLLGMLLAGQGGEAMSARESAAMDLAEAERAFSRTALERGVRAAFLEWLEPGATIFRPEPIDGPEFHGASEPSPALLIWEPAWVDMAASLDLGLSSGPWKYKMSADSPPVAFGHFISIWRKQAEGAWKVVADIGISCDSTDAAFGLPLLLIPGSADPGERGGSGNALAMEVVDAALRSRTGMAPNPAPLGAQVRLYRPGQGPIVGPEAVRRRLDGDGAASVVVREGSVTSQAGDFAATWGTEGPGEAPAPAFSFLRVWRRASTADPWQLGLEVRLPLE